MFSNTLSFLSSHNVSGQVSHPYKTTGKIRVPVLFKLWQINSQVSYQEFREIKPRVVAAVCNIKRSARPTSIENSTAPM